MGRASAAHLQKNPSNVVFKNQTQEKNLRNKMHIVAHRRRARCSRSNLLDVRSLCRCSRSWQAASYRPSAIGTVFDLLLTLRRQHVDSSLVRLVTSSRGRLVGKRRVRFVELYCDNVHQLLASFNDFVVTKMQNKKLEWRCHP